MKPVFSILFSLFVFLSGMNFSVATHYCQGKIAATKFSFSGEKASCGMEKCTSNYPAKGTQITSNCCIDEISVYTTDNNYTPGNFQTKKTIINRLQIILMPVKQSFSGSDIPLSASTNTGPPGRLFRAVMSLPEICAFRI
jgi:hypothetical protein